jgi:hypothetical protein
MLREGHKLRMFENRMLRRIFGPKRNDVMRGWRKLHNEELHSLHCAPYIIRVIKSRTMRWMGHVVHTREMRNVYKILVGKPEGKRPLRRPRHRWEDNIKMDLREIRFEGVDWIHLAQNRDHQQALVNMVMNLWFHKVWGIS